MTFNSIGGNSHMTLNDMKPAEGIYTTSEMQKVFTLHSVRVFTPNEINRGIYTAFSEGIYTEGK